MLHVGPWRRGFGTGAPLVFLLLNTSAVDGRWIKITPEYIAFGLSDKTRPINQIFFEDVVGVVYHGVDMVNEPDVWFRNVPEVDKDKERALALQLDPLVIASP
jgi:hypothetical protein